MSGITLNDLDSAVHSIEVKNAAGNALLIDGSGHISINDGGNVLSIDDAGGSLTVDAAELTAIQAAVELLDDAVFADGASFGAGKGLVIMGVDGSGNAQALNVDGDGNIQTETAPAATFVTTQLNVPTTAGGTQLKATALANRREVTIQNLGSQEIYISDGSGTTSADLTIPGKASATYEFGPSVDVYALASAGTPEVKFMEVA